MNTTIQFWSWFERSLGRLRALAEEGINDGILDECHDQLKSIHPELYFEIGGDPGGPLEMIVSALGDPALFDLVDDVIEAAPVLEGWVWMALKPAQGIGFRTTFEGLELDPKRMWFFPLENKSGDLGLHVSMPDLLPADTDRFKRGSRIVLETVLGERAFAEEVKMVDAVLLPDSPDEDGWIELSSLIHYIDWRKRQAQKN